MSGRPTSSPAIDPADGRITEWIDLTGVNPDPKKLVYPLVLNGTAYNTATRHLPDTVKCWPHVTTENRCGGRTFRQPPGRNPR